MRRALRLTAAAALLLGLLGLGWWLVAAPELGSQPGPRLGSAPTGSAVDSAPRELVSAEPGSLLADGAPIGPADDAAAAPADGAGHAVLFTGRVLDDLGRPVRDAEVVHLPSDPMREATGLDEVTQNAIVPWARFARARTDAQGRFSLPTRELAARATPMLDITVGNTRSSSGIAGRLPSLLVLHPALEPALFRAWAFARGAGEVGDLVVPLCGAVSGRLVDESGQPIVGASVHLSTGAPPEPEPRSWWLLRDLPRTISGSDGRFLLGGLWNGHCEVAIDARDLLPQHAPVTLNASQTTELGDVVLSRGGEVSGWVVATSGEPIAEATVILRLDGMPTVASGPDAAAVDAMVTFDYGADSYELRATTAADGAFRVAGVRARDAWRVVASAAGHEPTVLAGVKTGGEPLRLVLAPAAIIRLRVVEAADGAPVADARVEARRIAQGLAQQPWPLPLQVVPQGNSWQLVGAGAVRNEAIVSAPGHATCRFELPGVAPGEVLEQSVELPAEGVLAGLVVDDEGAPVPHAAIRARQRAQAQVEPDLRSTAADAAGRFELRGLDAGAWALLPQAGGCVAAEPVTRELQAGETVSDVRLQLVRGGRIAGRVLTRDVRAVLGRDVRAEPADLAFADQVARSIGFARAQPAAAAQVTSLAYKGVVDDRGEYAIDGLPAGAYRVTCHPGAQADAQVEAGAETRLDLTLHDPPRVRGRVTAAGAPVPGADVKLRARLQDEWLDDLHATTNAAGEYEFTLEAEGPEHGAELTASWNDARTRSTAVEPRFDHEDIVDLAFGGGALVGEVLDEAGAPLQVRARWTAPPRDGFSSDDQVEALTATDAQGRFRVELLPAGGGELVFWKDGRVGVTLRDLVVREGETTEVPRVVMRRGGALEVHVEGVATRDPLKRFQIRVRSLSDPGWEPCRFDVFPGEPATMRDIPAGDVELDVLKPVSPRDFEPLRTVPALVVAGQTTRFDQPAE